MKRIPLIVSTAAVCAAVAPATAGAQSSVDVARGATTVTLDAGTAAVLTGTGAGQLGLTLGVLRPARADLPRLRFPVTTGHARVGGDPPALRGGRIRHSGGISLSKGGAVLRLRRFIINVDRGVLTADAGGARVPILRLGGDIRLGVKGRRVTVSRVGLTFTPQAIGALNQTFGTALDTGAQIPFGTAVVRTRAVAR